MELDFLGPLSLTPLSTNATCPLDKKGENVGESVNKKRSTWREQVSLLKLERHAGRQEPANVGDNADQHGG